MRPTPGSARSVIAGLLAIMLAAAATQGTAHAQSAPPVIRARPANDVPDHLFQHRQALPARPAMRRSGTRWRPCGMRQAPAVLRRAEIGIRVIA